MSLHTAALLDPPVSYDPPTADSVAARRARIRGSEYRPSYAGWALLGLIAGFVVVALVCSLALPPSDTKVPTTKGLLTAIPSEASFQVAVAESLRVLKEKRPEGMPTRIEIGRWADYASAAAVPARARLSADVPPKRLEDTRDQLVDALGRYQVAVGAAQACLAHDPICLDEMSELKTAMHDTDRFAGDLRLYTFG